jgi:hypothetical protein
MSLAYTNRGWNAFWLLYLIFGDKERFFQNYTEAWWRRLREEQRLRTINPQNPTSQSNVNATGLCSVIMFRDSSQPILIPCRWDMTDEQFIGHIRNFYYLQRFRGGLLESLSLKTISHIEVIEVGRLTYIASTGTLTDLSARTRDWSRFSTILPQSCPSRHRKPPRAFLIATF